LGEAAHVIGQAKPFRAGDASTSHFPGATETAGHTPPERSADSFVRAFPRSLNDSRIRLSALLAGSSSPTHIFVAGAGGPTRDFPKNRERWNHLSVRIESSFRLA
jgi:hypothetical protein